MDSQQLEKLRKSYIETRYSVFTDDVDGKDPVDVYIGKPSPDQLNKLLENHNSDTAVILTAWNPESELLSLDENSKRNSELKEKLLRLDYIFYPAAGQGLELSWPAEESFFIVNMTQSQAQEIAMEFGQFAYVLIELSKRTELIFTPLWYK